MISEGPFNSQILIPVFPNAKTVCSVRYTSFITDIYQNIFSRHQSLLKNFLIAFPLMDEWREKGCR